MSTPDAAPFNTVMATVTQKIIRISSMTSSVAGEGCQRRSGRIELGSAFRENRGAVAFQSTREKGICSFCIDSTGRAEHLSNMVHTYRIEVWDEEESEIFEEISVATDSTVSQAAWHAALRVRPGFLLIHKNGSHVMEKLVTPGERPPDGGLERSYVKGLKGVDILLSDLRHWHQVTAFCAVCVRNAVIETDALMRRFGESASFGEIERKLVCRQCGRRDTVRLSVTKAPRD